MNPTDHPFSFTGTGFIVTFPAEQQVNLDTEVNVDAKVIHPSL